MLADYVLPHGSTYRNVGGYIVPEASHGAVTGSARPGRERLVKQPVSSGNVPCETEIHATFRSHSQNATDSLFWFGASLDHAHLPCSWWNLGLR